MVKRVIIDMDAGIDDALAIMLALRSPELRVEAITVVSGNVGVDKGHRNALRMLEVLDAREIPVVKGLDSPLMGGAVHASYYHGSDGLGDSGLPEPELKPHPGRAVDLLVDLIMASRDGEITLITTGPLTNVAVAMLEEPELANKIGGITMMGGAFGVTRYGIGNVTPAAEFNVYVDPEAARVVFDSGARIKAVGLDVTKDPSALMRGEDYEVLKDSKTRTATVAERITRKLFSRLGYVTLHDVLAVATLIDPGVVTFQRFPASVETRGEHTRGQTLIDRRRVSFEEQRWKPGPEVDVATSVDGRKFLDLFMERAILK